MDGFDGLISKVNDFPGVSTLAKFTDKSVLNMIMIQITLINKMKIYDSLLRKRELRPLDQFCSSYIEQTGILKLTISHF